MERLPFLNRRRVLILLRWVLRSIVLIVVVSALALLGLLVWSTGNASRYAQQYEILLGLNGVLAVALITWVLILTVRLLNQVRRRQFGARMTARFALYFTVMGMLPGVLIYVLSVQFMSRSIESWFNVRVDTALEAGLDLGRSALDAQLEDVNQRTQQLAREIQDSGASVGVVLNSLRQQAGFEDAMVFTNAGRIVAYSSDNIQRALPPLPPNNVLNYLRVAREYAATELALTNDEEAARVNATEDLQGYEPLLFRVVVPLGSNDSILSQYTQSSEKRWLQVVQPVPERLAQQASQVQQGYSDYQELAVSRMGLRKLYGTTLTLALILALFAAVAAAIAISRRLVRPLLVLASGTQAVGVGDYRPLPEPRSDKDEVGQLTHSFNRMTRQLDEARAMVENNRRQLERSNVYLESVLSSLSSGVLVFDESFKLTTYNAAAQSILGLDLEALKGLPLEAADDDSGFAQTVRQAFRAHTAVASSRSYWQQQFELNFGSEHAMQATVVTLLARGTALRVGARPNGYLVVFDDISDIISANRLVAWGEVARRLAHEIKNPLTPIQLSAERLAFKLKSKLEGNDAAMLERATNTIVNQVASLKQMVDDFREYARTPPAQLQDLDLNALIVDVLTLYGWEPEHPYTTAENGVQVKWTVDLQGNLPLIEGDPTQLRQIIHNLLSNASDATTALVSESGAPRMAEIEVRTTCSQDQGESMHGVRLEVLDNGPGFDEGVLARVFEPYVTTKATGTGLGLAIVKKIIEEHGGTIDVSNRQTGGARITILLTRLANLSKTLDNVPKGSDNA